MCAQYSCASVSETVKHGKQSKDFRVVFLHTSGDEAYLYCAHCRGSVEGKGPETALGLHRAIKFLCYR